MQSAADVCTTPLHGQQVLHNDKRFTTVKEGLAYILVPEQTTDRAETARRGAAEPQSVFYNPIQQFNRDLSVLAIRAYSEDLLARHEERHRHRGLKNGLKRQECSNRKRKANQAFKDLSNGQKRAETEVSSRAQGHQDHNDGEAIERPTTPTTEPRSKETPEAPKVRMKFKVLDALSATGLRALRYAQEIPAVTSVTANDMSTEATQSIRVNVEHNRLQDTIRATTGNAVGHMYSVSGLGCAPAVAQDQGKYNVIDLDPYGTAVPFLDAAVNALTDGGLLCVTCTDSALWASCGYPEKTYALYGGTPVKGLHSHEGGLRLILHSIASSAARYGKAVEPLLSLSVDYYARVFVRVYNSPTDVKMLAGKTMLVYNCDSGCGAWQTQFLARTQSFENKKGESMSKFNLAQGPSASQHCEHCGFKTHIAGPLYGGPLHNEAFIRRLLDYLPNLDETTYGTTVRLRGMLTTAMEESLEIAEKSSSLDHGSVEAEGRDERMIKRTHAALVEKHPFYFTPSALAKAVRCAAPGEAAVRGALLRAGYQATRSHCRAGSIRTDAPWTFLWRMMREWVRQKAPVREGAIRPGMCGWKLLKKAESSTTEPSNAIGERSKVDTVLRTHVRSDSQAEDEIIFDEELGRRRDKHIARYQENPRANWGPQNRAKMVV